MSTSLLLVPKSVHISDLTQTSLRIARMSHPKSGSILQDRRIYCQRNDAFDDDHDDDYLGINSLGSQPQPGTRTSESVETLDAPLLERKGLPLLSSSIGHLKQKPATHRLYPSLPPSPPTINSKISHIRVTKSSTKEGTFNAQDLDLPLDDDLWLPAERISEFMAGKGSSPERGMLFPWMSDSEIV